MPGVTTSWFSPLSIFTFSAFKADTADGSPNWSLAMRQQAVAFLYGIGEFAGGRRGGPDRRRAGLHISLCDRAFAGRDDIRLAHDHGIRIIPERGIGVDNRGNIRPAAGAKKPCGHAGNRIARLRLVRCRRRRRAGAAAVAFVPLEDPSAGTSCSPCARAASSSALPALGTSAPAT